MTSFLIFMIGLGIGSFLNVVIVRLHQGISPLKGRSKCPHCHNTLSWYELLPLVSFVAQKGRCRHCRTKISWQYPLIELSTGMLFAITQLAQHQATGFSAGLLHYVFLCILIVTFVTDLRWNLIYDAVLLPGIVLAFLAPLFSTYYVLLPTYSSLLLAGTVGAGVFGLQYMLSRGRWVGSGDILLGLFLGLMLGFPTILGALFFTYVSGSLVALLLMSTGRKTQKDTLPLGCFMSAVGILLLLITS